MAHNIDVQPIKLSRWVSGKYALSEEKTVHVLSLITDFVDKLCGS